MITRESVWRSTHRSPIVQDRSSPIRTTCKSTAIAEQLPRFAAKPSIHPPDEFCKTPPAAGFQYRLSMLHQCSKQPNPLMVAPNLSECWEQLVSGKDLCCKLFVPLLHMK
ncbi:hypothetical protein Droror1_Dr00012574 [Drosera rotundifolia]